jgi:hypothetical protein
MKGHTISPRPYLFSCTCTCNRFFKGVWTGLRAFLPLPVHVNYECNPVPSKAYGIRVCPCQGRSYNRNSVVLIPKSSFKKKQWRPFSYRNAGNLSLFICRYCTLLVINARFKNSRKCPTGYPRQVVARPSPACAAQVVPCMLSKQTSHGKYIALFA